MTCLLESSTNWYILDKRRGFKRKGVRPQLEHSKEKEVFLMKKQVLTSLMAVILSTACAYAEETYKAG